MAKILNIEDDGSVVNIWSKILENKINPLNARMERVLEKLQLQENEIIEQLKSIDPYTNGNTYVCAKKLKETLEEIELIASTVYLSSNDLDGNTNASPLTSDFYTKFLIILLIVKDLDNARFLWKRIPATKKEASQILCSVWEIGKALWTRDYTAAFNIMDQKTWSNDISPLILHLRVEIQKSNSTLLATSYEKISIEEAGDMLGMKDTNALVAYCNALNWEVIDEKKFIKPKIVPPQVSLRSNAQDLETISSYVLHLEQQSTVQLPSFTSN